jgi:hypothetical protein
MIKCAILLLATTLSKAISLPEVTIKLNATHTVFEDNELSPLFNLKASPERSCTPINLTVFKAKRPNQSSIALSVVNSGDEPFSLFEIIVSNYYQYQKLRTLVSGSFPTKLMPGNQTNFLITHLCPQKADNFNYWSVLNVVLKFSGLT